MATSVTAVRPNHQFVFSPTVIPIALAFVQVGALFLSIIQPLSDYDQNPSLFSDIRVFLVFLTVVKAIAGEVSGAHPPTNELLSSALLFLLVFARDPITLIWMTCLVLFFPGIGSCPSPAGNVQHIRLSMISIAFVDFTMGTPSVSGFAAAAAGLTIGALLFQPVDVFNTMVVRQNAIKLISYHGFVSFCNAFMSLTQMCADSGGINMALKENSTTASWKAVAYMIYAICMLLSLNLAVVQLMLRDMVTIHGRMEVTVVAAAKMGLSAALLSLVITFFRGQAVLFESP